MRNHANNNLRAGISVLLRCHYIIMIVASNSKQSIQIKVFCHLANQVEKSSRKKRTLHFFNPSHISAQWGCMTVDSWQLRALSETIVEAPKVTYWATPSFL
jgi:hypothetical protein